MVNKKYFAEIDIARGIGILLVVIGHSFPDVSTRRGITVPAFKLLHDIIYTFHMPLMFFLSGFLSQRLCRIHFTNEKVLYVKDRFVRLLVPYFSVGLFYMPVKLLLSKFANQPYDIKKLGLIFVGENPNGGLWYLYVLFVIQIILVFAVTKDNLKIVALVSAGISVMTVSLGISFYRIDDVLYYIIFVVCGLFVGVEYDYIERHLNRKMIVYFIVLFTVCVAIFLRFDFSVLKVICGFLGMICTFLISRSLGGGIARRLKLLGQCSMDIYVFHGMVMAAIRIVIWSLLRWNYYVCTFLMFLGGLFIPIIVSKLILKKSRILSLLFLGKS